MILFSLHFVIQNQLRLTLTRLNLIKLRFPRFTSVIMCCTYSSLHCTSASLLYTSASLRCTSASLRCTSASLRCTSASLGCTYVLSVQYICPRNMPITETAKPLAPVSALAHLYQIIGLPLSYLPWNSFTVGYI